MYIVAWIDQSRRLVYKRILESGVVLDAEVQALGAGVHTLPPRSCSNRSAGRIRAKRTGPAFSFDAEFDSALRDLDIVLSRRPDDAQAWLTRATILRVAHGTATPLAEVRRAAVTSLAATPRQLIAVLRRADGTTDAIAIPR